MVTEYPFAHQMENVILFGVKDLKQEQPRVYFRLPDQEMADFKAACKHYGGYQSVMERFARYFMGLDQVTRDAVLRRMSEATSVRPASATAAQAGSTKGRVGRSTLPAPEKSDPAGNRRK